MPRSRRSRKSSESLSGPVDWLTVGLMGILTLIGIVMIFNASNVTAYYQFSNKYYFSILQLLWLGIGVVGFFLALILPLKTISKLSFFLFVLTVILLTMVIIPGIGTKVQGARRWLIIGGFNLQPSEVAKLAAALYFPAFFKKSTRLKPFLVLIAVLLGLLILEPDMGTAMIIIGIASLTYYLAGAPIKHLAILSGVIVGAGLLLIFTSGYRMNRLKTFFDPTLDPQGSAYHIRQVLLSLGSGGFWGAGIGRSREKYEYLPEASTDSIFAVTAEEVGFLGSTVIILLYAVVYIRGFNHLRQVDDPYPRLVGSAVMAWFSLQTLMNIGAMVVLIPLTGVPLPFISYGGSSLIMTLVGLGFYANASRYRLQSISRSS